MCLVSSATFMLVMLLLLSSTAFFYLSENQIITNRHYYAHFLQFLCATKNRAYRHSWNTLQLQWQSTALFLSAICEFFMYVLYDYCYAWLVSLRLSNT
jgi:hypothetical protein